MSYKEVSYEDAIKIMKEVRKETDDIGIFTDRGWGDDPTVKRSYDIVRDGNGQKPIASISKETFKKLRENKLIGRNRLQTFKARTFHYFKEELQG